MLICSFTSHPGAAADDASVLADAWFDEVAPRILITDEQGLSIADHRGRGRIAVIHFHYPVQDASRLSAVSQKPVDHSGLVRICQTLPQRAVIGLADVVQTAGAIDIRIQQLVPSQAFVELRLKTTPSDIYLLQVMVPPVTRRKYPPVGTNGNTCMRNEQQFFQFLTRAGHPVDILMCFTYYRIPMPRDRLVQTRIPLATAEEVDRVAEREGMAVATWLRRLIMKEINSMYIEAWVSEKSRPANRNTHADYYLKRVKDISPTEIEFALLHGPAPYRAPAGAPVTPAFLEDVGWYQHIDDVDFVLKGSEKRWRVLRSFYDSNSRQMMIVLASKHFIRERTDHAFLEKLALAEKFIQDIERGDHRESDNTIEFSRQTIIRGLASEAAWTVTPLPNFGRFAKVISKLEELGHGAGPTAKEILDIEIGKKEGNLEVD